MKRRRVLSSLKTEAMNGWSVGIRPRQLLSLGNNVLDLVQPSVIVHAVDIDTGLYVHSARRHVSVPLVTRGCPMKDCSTIPTWNEDLIIDANFMFVALFLCIYGTLDGYLLTLVAGFVQGCVGPEYPVALRGAR
jgi:hypothetical protein